MRYLLLLLLAYISPALAAQNSVSSRYDAQIQAIEQMLADGRYPAARSQSEALADDGALQRLEDLEAYGNYLLARAILEDPGSDGKERIRAVRLLQRAGRNFRNPEMRSWTDSIVDDLRNIARGDRTIDELPGVGDLRAKVGMSKTLSAEELDNQSLGAIVALQNQEIEALSDSQLRQLVQLRLQSSQLDSLQLQSLNDSLLLMRQNMELEAQRALTQEERQRRNFFIVLVIGVLVALVLLYSRFRSSQRYRTQLAERNKIIDEERRRSDNLLLNVLPAAVAEELKDTGKATARRYEGATVLFSDFVGFSRIASETSPEKLVAMLDRNFGTFDEIVERHGLEKIKTIGDAYMCVGGIPHADGDTAGRTVSAALEIQEYLVREGDFRARIGIHSGPVVAGVVGQNKFAFDIWGDTVNQAARLEKSGRPGEVTISSATCERLGEEFECTNVGTFEAKNIGTLDRYEVRVRRAVKNPS